MNLPTLKITSLTVFALIAFAGNSVLCRLALGEAQLDAAGFTIIRLLSGIIILLLVSQVLNAQSKSKSKTKRNWFSAVALFIYAIAFSYAYVSLETGTGALILFGSVQITMIIANLFMGNRLQWFEWCGVATAFAGFIFLVLPSLTAPSFQGFSLMTLAGAAWGIYTLRGKGSTQPINDTAVNFLYTLPFVLALLIIEFGQINQINQINLSSRGIILAVASGAIASGIGYTVWYMAVRELSTIQAAVVQLLVPIIAGAGGVIFAQETISLRLILAAVMILGGIALVILGQSFQPSRG